MNSALYKLSTYIVMILTAITFIIVLSLLVFVHELGHYLAARTIGVEVEEFGFGLPPKIVGKKIEKTVYSLNWLPIGGFVRLAGEDAEEADIKKHLKHDKKAAVQKYFWGRNKRERSMILLAGVAMNFITAIILTMVLLMYGIPAASGRVHIESVVSGSPASMAGLVSGDVVKRIVSTVDSITIHTPDDIVSYTKNHLGESLTLVIERNNQEQLISLVPRANAPKGEGAMGISISDLELKRYTFIESIPESFKITIDRAVQMFVGLYTFLAKLFSLQNVSNDVAGPIGIAQVTGKAVQFGITAVIEFMSILSLNLAVLNILPIPALDGGRFLFVVIEAITGKRVRAGFERKTHQIGMMILFTLIFLISLNDILRISRGG